MSALALMLLRIGLLVALWIFVLFVVVTVRNDVYGTRIRERHSSRSRPAPRPVRRSSDTRQSMLVVTGGPLTGTTLPLGSTAITVGRSPDSALVLDDGFASARHARFSPQGGTCTVEDLNSTNGTWVNNQRIARPVTLRPGDSVTIGKTTMELRQ